MQTQAQVVALSSIMGASLILPNFDSTPVGPLMCRLGRSFALGHIGKFACVTRVLAPFALILSSSKIISVLLALYPLDTNSPCLDSLWDFQPNSNLELSVDFFRSTFLHMFHLSSSGLYGMVFEHLQDYFDLKDLVNGVI